MRFKVDHHHGHQLEVQFSTVTHCRIVEPDGTILAQGSVGLNHHDKYDPVIGQREALKKALHVFEKREERLPFWERWAHLAIYQPRKSLFDLPDLLRTLTNQAPQPGQSVGITRDVLAAPILAARK